MLWLTLGRLGRRTREVEPVKRMSAIILGKPASQVLSHILIIRGLLAAGWVLFLPHDVSTQSHTRLCGGLFYLTSGQPFYIVYT